MDKAASTQHRDTALRAEVAALRAENQRLQAEMSRQQTLIRALGEEAARYRNLIAASNDAIFLIDPERDQILEANPVACRMLGYTQAELLALGISAIHPAEMPQLLCFARQVFAKGQGWTDELSCRTKDGATLPAEISASLVEIGGRTCLLALVRDTTERKRAAARIQQEAARADALTRVAARLNAQLDLATVLDAICEETARALHISAAVLLFFDEQRQLFHPVATYGLPPTFKTEYIPNPRSVYEQYPQHGSQIVVPNLRALPNLVNAKLFEAYNIHAIAIASLNRADHLLGALCAYALEPDHLFSDDDINLLRSLADLGAQAVRNAILYQAEQRRSAQFQTLSEVGRHITAFLQEDELIHQIAQSVRQLFRQDQVGILLLAEDELVIVEPPPRLPWGQGQGIPHWVARHGQAALVGDVTQDSRYGPGTKERIRSELAVPMKVQQRVIGVLAMESEMVNAYTEMDAIVLQSLADQAAVAIENARLYAQTRQIAVLEERQRLARELHDSVTQSLYGLTLYTAAAREHLVTGEVRTVGQHLDVIQETVQLALREMRLLIFQLRSPSLQAGLAVALQERLEAVEARSGVKTAYTVTGISCADPDLEAELYRVAQEALNNALKHARAQCVRLHLQQEKERLCLQIEDDGVGFETRQIARSAGLGLRGMQERVAALGGVLTIQSTPGQGTLIQVEVKLP